MLTLEDGTDSLSRNVGKKLPLYILRNITENNIWFASRRKPEITNGANVLEEMACDVWTGFAQLGIGNTVAFYNDSDEPSGSMKGEEFLH